MEFGGDEIDFHKAKYFYDHIKQLRLPDYYTEINEKSWTDNRPWSSDITIGKRFNSDGQLSSQPVLFSRFNNSHGEFLARSPISTISILESSAMAQELTSNYSLLAATNDEFGIVERKLFEKRILEQIYNSNMTEYSVCVHFVANNQNCEGIYEAFQLCAALTRLVLNFPEKAFEHLAANCPLPKILLINKGSEIESRFQSGLESMDLGILFYLLTLSLPEESYKDQASVNFGIEKALSKVGITSKELEALTTPNADELFSKLELSSITAISTIAKAAKLNFNTIQNDGYILDYSALNLPPVFLNDSKQFDVFPSQQNSLTGFDLEHCFDELCQGQLWVEKFSEACI
jgi:hypothetical protein